MKKLFYLVYIGIGVIILFQASKLVGTVIERRLLREPPPVSIDLTEETVGWSIPRTEYDISLFSSPLFTIREPAQGPVEEGEVSEAAVDSPLTRNYQLNGVILLPRGKSMALIRRTRERDPQIYRKGDMIDSYELVKIERQRVLMSDGLTTSALPMYVHQAVQRQSGIRPAPRKPDTSEDYSDAKSIRKVLSRSDVESRVFSKVNEILTQIAISPYMVNGQMQGLRLIRVPNESIVYELGGRSGDIVKRVNGRELDQIDQMYKLWENIKDDSQITVDLERKNQMFSYSFDIRE
jgi:type II secretion system protein C